MKQLIVLLMALLLVAPSSLATPLSVIDSQYLISDDSINGPVFLVNVRGDNDASYLVFGQKEQLQAETPDGDTVSPAEDFRLTQSIESQSCEYNLVNTARNDIYQYEIDQVGNNVFFTRKDDLMNQCYEDGGVLAWGRTTLALATQDVYCLREDKIANAGAVSEGRINFESLFSLQKGDDNPIVKTISTLATNQEDIPSQVLFSDGSQTVAKIRWIGGTTFGETCPGQDEFVAIERNNRWYTADRDSFLLYNDQYAQLNELIDKVETTDEITSDERRDIERLVAAVNERGSASLAEKRLSVDSNSAEMIGSVARVNLPRDHLIYAPDFQISLSAQWLGFVFQSSRPEIVDANFNSCTEEGSNSLYATIKNVGDQTGTFDVGVTCQGGLSLSATTRSIQLDPEETGTVTLPFSVSLASDQQRSCTIVVQDRQDVDRDDRQVISTSCQASTFCSVEGQVQCFGEVESECNSGQWVPTGSDNCLTSTCNRDNVCDGSSGESFEACGGKLASDNDCATCNLNGRCESTETSYSCSADCGPVSEPIPQWIYWVGGIALGVVVYFGITSIKPAKGKKGSKRRKRK